MRTLPLAIAISLVAGAAFAAPPVKTVETAKGNVLAAANGMTLYTYKDDHGGVSSCYDACAKNWPPFMVEGDAKAEGAFTIVERKDGTKQWAKDGMPLYFWIKDKKMGDITGDGVKGEWDVVKP
ncbi:COG4315 family predicted lipoprotein [Ensifer sp. 4252]|uniref:COG4315 family predicted lipoprotein n=1 Tax=Ensifer sp. 4252 TaxID=3373915 RepID=UPI003D1FB69A